MAENGSQQGQASHPHYPPYHPQPRRSSGCLPWLVLLLLLGLGGSMLLNLALLGGQVQLAQAGAGTQMREEVIRGEGPDKVLVIDIDGVIAEEDGTPSPFAVGQRMVTEVKRRLEAAGKNDLVRAVVLRVDSPGGTISASDQIWKAITDFRERTELPLVVSMGATCASGGYYVSAPADVLIAEPTTITGSIGVLLTTFNVAALLERIGVEGVTIKAGARKDLLNMFEPLRPEDVAIMEGVVDDAYERFVDVVVKGRSKVGLTEERVRELADGRVYTAGQALEHKLIDELGYLDDAIERARELAQLPRAQAFRYRDEPSFLDVLAGRVSAPPLGIELSEAALLEMTTPRVLYLWR